MPGRNESLIAWVSRARGGLEAAGWPKEAAPEPSRRVRRLEFLALGIVPPSSSPWRRTASGGQPWRSTARCDRGARNEDGNGGTVRRRTLRPRPFGGESPPSRQRHRAGPLYSGSAPTRCGCGTAIATCNDRTGLLTESHAREARQRSRGFDAPCRRCYRSARHGAREHSSRRCCADGHHRARDEALAVGTVSIRDRREEFSQAIDRRAVALSSRRRDAATCARRRTGGRSMVRAFSRSASHTHAVRGRKRAVGGRREPRRSCRKDRSGGRGKEKV